MAPSATQRRMWCDLYCSCETCLLTPPAELLPLPSEVRLHPCCTDTARVANQESNSVGLTRAIFAVGHISLCYSSTCCRQLPQALDKSPALLWTAIGFKAAQSWRRNLRNNSPCTALSVFRWPSNRPTMVKICEGRRSTVRASCVGPFRFISSSGGSLQIQHKRTAI